MNKDYKDTLHLPKTSFPMKANLPTKEPLMLDLWDKLELHKLRDLGKTKDFKLLDGPPYANGKIHIGHALNKILKDIILKSKSLSGYRATYIPGWDCHGLPVELNVEKKHKIEDPIEFISKCREYVDHQINTQLKDFHRLGIVADWDNRYASYDPGFEANIVRSLAKLYKNNMIKQGFKPVYWCVNCGSSLAEAEVEYQNKSSDSIYVKFQVSDSSELPENTSVVIWTTTPWTLPANEAVCLNENLSYSLVKFGEQHLIIAAELVSDLASKLGQELTELKQLPASSLQKTKLKHPFIDKHVPIIFGDHVTTDSGTGCVHTAPSHGLEDYVVSLKYDLPVNCPVDARGKFKSEVEHFAGEFAPKANPLIISMLEQNGSLVLHNKFEHSYPHCWRHKTPLMFRATPQWFLDLSDASFRQSLTSELKQVDFDPSWGSNRMESMVTNRPDWCISRQRRWSTPMCLVLDKETDEPHPELANIMEQVADKIEQHGIEIWQSISLDELGIDSSRYYKKFDTLDVWFDSGVVHTASKDSSDEYVADLYLEGSDQYRGWFNSSLLTSVAMYGKAPYKKVLTHGFVVDGKGRKMSKSIGNIIEPEKVIKQMGADVLRLWVAASEYRTELSVSNEILERVKEAYRRIRNTARFLLANISDLDLNRRVKSEELLSIDKWLLYRVNLLQEEIIEHYNNFNFHLIYKTIFNFCSNDLGGFYLDVVKDRQYTGAKNGLARRSAQTAMDHALRALTKWIAPILSFTAEEIWQTMRTKAEDPSIFIGNWYQCPKVEFSDLQFWQHIIGLREKVNKQIEHMRASGDIGSALDVSVKLYLNDDWMALLQPGADELHYIFLTSRVEIEQFQDLGVELLSGVNAEFSKIELKKCSRCWHRCIPTDSSDEICSRCQVNLTEEGEARAYA